MKPQDIVLATIAWLVRIQPFEQLCSRVSEEIGTLVQCDYAFHSMSIAGPGDSGHSALIAS